MRKTPEHPISHCFKVNLERQWRQRRKSSPSRGTWLERERLTCWVGKMANKLLKRAREVFRKLIGG